MKLTEEQKQANKEHVAKIRERSLAWAYREATRRAAKDAKLAQKAEEKPKSYILESDKKLAGPQSAKKDSAAAEVKDTRTTKQKRDDAQKAYDGYVASDEHKQRLDDAYKTAWEDTMRQVFANPGVPASDLLNSAAQKMPVDSKEQELKATMDHYQRQMDAEEGQRIMDTDLKELESWSNEDRHNLDRYIIERDQHAAIMPGEPQVDTYNLNPLVQKYGIDKVRQMAESVQRSQNAEMMRQTEEAGKKMGDEHAVLGSGASVATNLAGAITGPVGFVTEIGQRTGRYPTFDPNNVGNLPAAYGGAVRGQVTENIKGDGQSWLRNLAALGYQGGMSALDSAARIAASGGSAGISSALAASGTFSNSIRQYSQQGASPERAAAMALTSSGLEYVTEKLPTEEVLKLFKGGYNASTIKNVLTQAFLVEPTSEEVNLFAGVAAETAILGEKSSKNQRIGELVANGMSYQDAQKQFYSELWKEAAETYAVSAISGGISSAGAAKIGGVVNSNNTQEIAQEGAQDSQTVQNGGEFGLSPNAPKPLNGGSTVTEQDTGGLTPEEQQVQQILAATGQEFAQKVPRQEMQPVAPEQAQLDAAVAQTLGVQQEQQTAVDAASTTEVPNAQQGDNLEDSSVKLEKDMQDYPYDTQKVIEGYEESVDPNVVSFVDRVKNGQARDNEKVQLGSVNEKMAAEMERLTGVQNIAGKPILLNTDRVRHIEKRHGQSGKHDHSMQNGEDIGRINYILQNFDNCVIGEENSKVFLNKDGTPAKTVVFDKKINGTYFVVEAVPDTDKTWIVTAYITNQKNGAAKVPDVNAPNLYAQNDPTAAPDNNIPGGAVDVKMGNGVDTGINGTGAAENNLSGDDTTMDEWLSTHKQSKLYENTMKRSTDPEIRAQRREVLKTDPTSTWYETHTEADENAQAQARTDTTEKILAERDYLIRKEKWTDADVKTSFIVSEYLMKNDKKAFVQLSQKRREIATGYGQAIQAFAEYTRRTTASGAADHAIQSIAEMGEKGIDPKYYKRKGFKAWSETVDNAILNVANEIEQVQDGDTETMKKLIRDISELRNTKMDAGIPILTRGATNRALSRCDFEAMKQVAIKQLSMIPDDFRKRSKGEVVKSIQDHDRPAETASC